MVGSIDANSDARFGFSFEPVGLLAELHERAEAPGEHEHGEAGLGIGAELAGTAAALGEQLLGLLGRELVGREVGGDRCLLVAALDVRAVGPDPHDELAALGVVPDVHRVDLGLVDLREVLLGDELAQARPGRCRSRRSASHFSASPSPRAIASSASSIVAVNS